VYDLGGSGVWNIVPHYCDYSGRVAVQLMRNLSKIAATAKSMEFALRYYLDTGSYSSADLNHYAIQVYPVIEKPVRTGDNVAYIYENIASHPRGAVG